MNKNVVLIPEIEIVYKKGKLTYKHKTRPYAIPPTRGTRTDIITTNKYHYSYKGEDFGEEKVLAIIEITNGIINIIKPNGK